MGHLQVQFSGELTPGADPAQVRRNLAERFAIDKHKVDQLFSGRTVVLRSELDEEAAFALQSELEALGARTRIKDRGPVVRREDPYSVERGKAPDAEKVGRDPTLKDITAAHFECPRCGFMQLETEHCVRCGVNLAQAMREKRKEDRQIEQRIRELRARQARAAQQGRERAAAWGRPGAREGAAAARTAKSGGWWRRLWPVRGR